MQQKIRNLFSLKLEIKVLYGFHCLKKIMDIVIANKTHADRAKVALVNRVRPQNMTKSR